MRGPGALLALVLQRRQKRRRQKTEDSGHFSYNSGNGTVNWSAVPEPSSALAGLLLGAGLLRRRR